MSSPWIQHVKKCASDFGINYPQALKDPRTRASYHKMKGGSRINKAEKWKDFSYNTAKQAIHLVPKAAKAYSKSSRALAKSF
jgi:glucose-6-phosphate isomerase